LGHSNGRADAVDAAHGVMHCKPKPPCTSFRAPSTPSVAATRARCFL
jgi:hypothetical protein